MNDETRLRAVRVIPMGSDYAVLKCTLCGTTLASAWSPNRIEITVLSLSTMILAHECPKPGGYTLTVYNDKSQRGSE